VRDVLLEIVLKENYLTTINGHLSTVFVGLLAALDCKPHEMVLKNLCKPPLIVSRSCT